VERLPNVGRRLRGRAGPWRGHPPGLPLSAPPRGSC